MRSVRGLWESCQRRSRCRVRGSISSGPCVHRHRDSPQSRPAPDQATHSGPFSSLWGMRRARCCGRGDAGADCDCRFRFPRAGCGPQQTW